MRGDRDAFDKNELLTATIKSTGAELISLKSEKGVEYIWQRDPRYWSGSAPFLFPIVGNLRDKNRDKRENISYEHSRFFARYDF